MIFLLEIFLTVLILLFFIIGYTAEGHKFIDTSENDDNNNFKNALTIPNHTISWAIYQELLRGEADTRFYKFQNEQINNSLYVQLSIPEIEKYKTFTPSLVLLEPQIKSNNVSTNKSNDTNVQFQNNRNSLPFEIPPNYRILLKTDYQGSLPSPIFYEPFTQTSYWERQEIRTQIQNLGTYYIVVFINDNNSNIAEGKFTLAVGELEDFSALDFLILLPYSWIKLKIFYNDYLSLVSVIIIVILFILVILLFIKRRRHKK